MAARAFTTLLMLPLAVQALESMDEASMSDVVAQEGVRLKSEYEYYVQNISLIDTDDGGKTSMSDITYGTRVNRQQVIDVVVSSERALYDEIHGAGAYAAAGGTGDGKLGLAFFNRDLPYDMEVGAIEINGKSVAAVGITDFEVNAFRNHADAAQFLNGIHDNELSLNVTAFAGGQDGRGITLDVAIPKTAQYEQYVEVNGVQFIGTVRHIDADPNDPDLINKRPDGTDNAVGQITTLDDYEGGLNMTGLTIDGVSEGMRIGLPTIEGGLIAITDFRIGNEDIGYEFLNDIVLKNINLTGGYLLLKPAENAGDSSIGFDADINSGTGFTYIYRDSKDQIRADVELTQDLQIRGAEINTYADTGLEIGLGSIKGQAFVDNVTLAPNYLTEAERGNLAPLGELTVNLNIAAGSYLRVQGN